MFTCSLRSYPSQWLKCPILGLQCLYMISMITNCEIELDGKKNAFHKASDLTMIHRWSSPVWKRSSIEPNEILTRWWSSMYMAVFLSGPRCVKLPFVTSPRRVSLHRQVCHHCLPRRLSLWQPPVGPGVTSLPAHWRLGLRTPNCNEYPNCLLSTCSSVHVLLSLFYVIDCHDMWLCIHNEWDICLNPSGQ